LSHPARRLVPAVALKFPNKPGFSLACGFSMRQTGLEWSIRV
jgi:hypothetical protein